MKSFLQKQYKYAPQFGKNIIQFTQKLFNGELKYIRIENKNKQFLGNLIVQLNNLDISQDLHLKNKFKHNLEKDSNFINEYILDQQENQDEIPIQTFSSTKFIVFPDYQYTDERLQKTEYKETEIKKGNLYYCILSEKICISLKNQNLDTEPESVEKQNNQKEEEDEDEQNTDKQDIEKEKNIDIDKLVDKHHSDVKQFFQFFTQEDKYVNIGFIKNMKLANEIFKEQKIVISEIGTYKQLLFNKFLNIVLTIGGVYILHQFFYDNHTYYFSPLISQKQLADQIFPNEVQPNQEIK